jgi:hypothetical protein
MAIVRDMKQMFMGAASFNHDDSSWNVSSTINMTEIFQGATSFNQNLCAGVLRWSCLKLKLRTRFWTVAVLWLLTPPWNPPIGANLVHDSNLSMYEHLLF